MVFFFSLESTGDWRRNVENFKGEAALRQFYGSATEMVLCTSRPFPPIFRDFAGYQQRVQGERVEGNDLDLYVRCGDTAVLRVVLLRKKN